MSPPRHGGFSYFANPDQFDYDLELFSDHTNLASEAFTAEGEITIGRDIMLSQ